MNELQEPDLQIILFIKEGRDFNFVKQAVRVNATLNGYSLQTEKAPPGHTIYFNSQLVWEITTKILRDLRTQNVPIKVEVYSSANEDNKQKLGYFLVNLAGAQTQSSSKLLTARQVWHKLLGVPSVGKYHSPQLLIGLSMHHIKKPSKESSSARSFTALHKPSKNVEDYLLALNNYSSTLDVKLDTQDGVIVVGPDFEGDSLYLLSITIGCAEHLDTIQIDNEYSKDEDCFVSYKLFDQMMTSDKRPFIQNGQRCSRAYFNQKINHRVRSCLPTLFNYFHDRPYCIIVIDCGKKKLGVCSIDMRKVVTGNINIDGSGRTVCERCFIMSSSQVSSRRAYLDVVVDLHYVKPWQEIRGHVVDPDSEKKIGSATLENGNMMRKSITMADFRILNKLKCSIDTDDGVLPEDCNDEAQNQEITTILRQIQLFFSNNNKSCETAKNNSACQTFNPDIVNFDRCIQTEQERSASPILFKESHSHLIKQETAEKYLKEMEEWKYKEKEKFLKDINKERLEVNKLKSELGLNLEHCRNLAEHLNKATMSLMEKAKLVNSREKKLITARDALEKHYTKVLRKLEVCKPEVLETNDCQWHMEPQNKKHNSLTATIASELKVKLLELEKENENLRQKLEDENKYKELNRNVRKIIERR